MLIKVSEATPLQLDYMVGYALGLVAKLHGVIPFSTDWGQGGPIIEREKIAVLPDEFSSGWEAHTCHFDGQDEDVSKGCTPLIAAMRCYVVAKWNHEVEIPEELK